MLLQALLKLVCEMGKAAGHADHLNRMTVSLYAVLVCEVLIATPKVRTPPIPPSPLPDTCPRGCLLSAA